MPLRTLLAFLLCGWLSLSAQQNAPLGESLRVQVSGPVGLQAALAQHGVIGDHVQVHQQGAWQTATVIVGKQELRELRAALPPGTLFLVCLLYTSPSPRDATLSRMPSSA